jgi:group I intron endonuclease
MSADKPAIRNWVIYKITSPSGRVYIGKSSNYKQRLRQYKCIQLKEQNLITRSLVKYGFESHNFSIIDSFTSNSDFASGKEMFWIRSFMSNRSKYPEQNGMNMTEGGEGALGNVRSEEFKKRVSEWSRGRKQSDEQRRSTSERSMGNKYNLGRIPSDDTRRKMSISQLGKKRTEETRLRLAESNQRIRNKAVIKYDLKGDVVQEFESVKLTALQLGISKETVRRLIVNRGRPNYAQRNYILKYK